MSASSFLSFYIFILLAVHCFETGFGFSSGNEEIVKLGCIERERQALLMIKQELIDEYGHLSSWGNEEHNKDCCKWRGVSCSNRTGHVVSLNLNFKVRTRCRCDFGNYKPLKGNISASLLELLHLNYLNLGSNDFGGQRIPEFIASLNKLRHLDLSYANFDGRVPYQLRNLSSLRTLDLSENNIYADKLEWLSHLFSLRRLALNEVILCEATDWLQVVSGLPSLEKLELRSCNLPSVTTSSISFVNSSKSLAFLDLAGSKLTHSMYPWLSHYSSTLVYLELADNNLQGPLPDYIFSNMTSLVDLSLSRNKIDGIPQSFRNLCRLKTLYLDSNNLTGQLPAEVFQNSSSCIGDTLEDLSLENNALSGSLPDFAGFSSLKELIIGENELNGTISKSIGQLFKLEYLDVHSNSLEGMITETHLSDLSRLRILDLSQNLLSLNFSLDWIPPFQLEFILFAGCKMGPHFPNWLQTQNTFSVVDISQSGILDIVPDWFWDLSPNLYHLNLSHNQLSGMLPELSLKLNGYPSIDLSSNCFEGSIPAMPPHLTSLFLSKNKFSGSISFLCGINGTLSFLDLSDNQLSGEMPECFGDYWRNLHLLNLANNNFSGQIPKRLGFDYCLIEVLDLNNNSLVGELPSSLKNCTGLNFLNLGNNKLSGTIPTWIGDSLSYLIVLSLRSNQFHGKLPIQLCKMEKVQILDFSCSNISGTIPKCLKNLTAMVNRSSSVNITIRGGSAMLGESKNRTFFANFERIYLAHINLVWKEITREYRNTLGLVKSIDLSSNKLVGVIPEEITSLLGLISLNLSSNNLSGPIPPNIGQLNWLNSLDLSKNMLTGKVPESFSQLDSLGYLNLSNNNLSGKIPSSTKPQSFDASSYMGNTELCGPPLPNKCVEDEPAQGPEIECPENTMCDNEKGAFTQGFYVSLALGFFTGFWGVCGTLVLKKSWRYAYFQFLNDMKDKHCLYRCKFGQIAWARRH